MSELFRLARRLMRRGRRTLFFAAYATAATLPPVPAAAQLKPPRGKPVVLQEVVVTATRVEESSFDLPVSIDRVDRDVIREDKAQVTLSEYLNRLPGSDVR